MYGVKITVIGDLREAFTYGSLIVKHALTGRKVIALGTPGYYTVVDSQDYEMAKARTWYALTGKNTYYAMNGSSLLLHRAILGGLAADVSVDHIDGDGLNNTRANLRTATHSQNQANRGPNRNNTSGFKGVYRRGDRWVAQICVNSDRKHLGRFASAEEAARAYDRAALAAWGPYALPNFPQETT